MCHFFQAIHYGGKVKRRQRLKSVTSNCSDDEKPKKKKKNAMTKAEVSVNTLKCADFSVA